MKVKLAAVTEAIEDADTSDETAVLFHVPSGEFIWVSDDESLNAQNGISEEELDEHAEDYLRLPSKWDINDYHIMEEFIDQLANAEQKNALYDSIRGRGAFRLFRATTDRFDLTDQWYAFRDQTYVDMAKTWCQENHLEFVEE